MYVIMISDSKAMDIRATATFHDEREAMKAFSATFKAQLKLAGATPGYDGLPVLGRSVDTWAGKNERVEASYVPGNFVIRKLTGEEAGTATFASLKLLPFAKKNTLFILSLSLVRVRYEALTPEVVGMDNYFIPLTESERAIVNQPDGVKSLLLEKIHSSLQSAQGWRAIQDASMDFNWGDMVMCNLQDVVGAIPESEAAQYPTVQFTLIVNQDELLAPEDAVVTWECFCEDSDSPVIVDTAAVFNMKDGVLYLSADAQDRLYQLLGERKTTTTRIRLKNGDIIPCTQNKIPRS